MVNGQWSMKIQWTVVNRHDKAEAWVTVVDGCPTTTGDKSAASHVHDAP